MTVHRVLYGSGPVAEATRKRVLQIAERLNYRPNAAARALRSGRTGVVGFLSPLLGTRLHATQTLWLHRAARLRGYDLMVGTIPDSGNPARAEWSMPAWLVDGLFIIGGFFGPTDRAALPRVENVPLVSMGTYFHPSVDHVASDLYPAAVAAMQHLVEAGRRRIAYMAVSPPAGCEFPHVDRPRYRAYGELMAAAGLQEQEILAPEDSSAAARLTLSQYLGQHQPPDAIFCSNDELALGAYRGLCDAGLRVPDQVALVGCDGLEDTKYLEVPLTTIVQPWEDMVAKGWEFMQRRWREPQAPVQSARLEAKLVVRASTDPAWQPDLVWSPPEGIEIAVPTMSVGG